MTGGDGREPETGWADALVRPRTGDVGPIGPALVEALFTHSPLSVALYDADGRVTAANAAYERHWGLRLADVPADYSIRRDPQLAASGVRALIERAYAGDPVVLPPVPYDAGQAAGGPGRRVWTAGHCYPVRGPGGQVTHVAVVHEDVTARVEAEVALRTLNAELEERNTQLHEQAAELEAHGEELASTTEELMQRTEELAQARDAMEEERARLARVVAQLPAAVAVFEGPQLVFRAVSGAYQQIVGGRDVLGRPIREALPELAGARDFFALLEGVYRTGEPVVGTDVAAYWDDDGDGELEEHRIDLVYAPLRGAPMPGEPPERAPIDGVTALVLDVTERARAQEAVRESEARFRNMADNAPVMLWVRDTEGRCVFLNAEWYAFTGQTPEQALGLGWLDAVHPDDAAASARVFLAAHGARAPFRLDYRLRRHDGVYRWAVDSAAPRFDTDGDFLGYMGSVVDIDERAQLLAAERAAREAAEAANAAKAQFLGALHHEYRTPLNAILGYVDLLELGLRGPVTEAQRADLARIKRASQVLLSLVNDVLNFTRLEAGALELHVEPVRLDGVLQELEDLVRPQLAARGLAYDHDACGEALVVAADRERLRIVLLNLLTNAVKFTAAGGQVALTCDDDAAAGVVRLRVRDTGRGIPADKLAAIFEPFVQVDRHLTQASQQGVGLGLAISRDLARRMGGDLAVESAVGVGSTFTLTLRRAVEGA